MKQCGASLIGAWSKFRAHLITAKVHRQTLRAAFWLHLLHDSVGVRMAGDLELLEPWMLLKGSAYRDADSVVQHVMSSARSWFKSGGAGSNDVGVELLSQKHLDAYYDFNSPLNVAKLLRCLGSDTPAPIEGDSFADRGFVEVESR